MVHSDGDIFETVRESNGSKYICRWEVQNGFPKLIRYKKIFHDASFLLGVMEIAENDFKANVEKAKASHAIDAASYHAINGD